VALNVKERTIAQASIVPFEEDEGLDVASATRDAGRISARRPANAGKPWSLQEDSDLLDYDAERFPIHDAAELLCREVHDVIARLEALRPKARAG
jgi:hypothetical protein